jgi:hypothetical protein
MLNQQGPQPPERKQLTPEVHQYSLERARFLFNLARERTQQREETRHETSVDARERST